MSEKRRKIEPIESRQPTTLLLGGLGTVVGVGLGSFSASIQPGPREALGSAELVGLATGLCAGGVVLMLWSLHRLGRGGPS